MKINRLFTVGLALATLFTGCTSDDDACRPGLGAVSITTDWSNRTNGVAVPATYTVELGGYSTQLSGLTNTLGQLFEPGTYPLRVYNSADNVTVAGNQATIATVTTPVGGTGLFISPMPGWFFSSSQQAEIEANAMNDFTAVMTQNVGEITLVLEPTGGSSNNISTITGWLSGMGSTLNIDNNHIGGPANIPVTFTRDPVDGRWKATIRSIGTIGPEQILTGMIEFSDGTPNQPIQIDLSGPLSGFNNNKVNFPPLGGQIIETSSGILMIGTINEWNPGNGSGGIGTAN